MQKLYGELNAGIMVKMNTNSLTYKLAVLKAADMAIYDYSSDDSPLYGTLSELAQKYGGNGDDVLKIFGKSV